MEATMRAMALTSRLHGEIIYGIQDGELHFGKALANMRRGGMMTSEEYSRACQSLRELVFKASGCVARDFEKWGNSGNGDAEDAGK
jgi:hypothetical protein